MNKKTAQHPCYSIYNYYTIIIQLSNPHTPTHILFPNTYSYYTVLSVMIVFAVIGLIDISTLRRYWQVSKWDFATMLVTLSLTLILGVANGVLASIGFSILVFIHYAAKPNISRLGRYFGSTEYAPVGRTDSDGTVVYISQVLIVRFEAPLFFANCRTLNKTLLSELVLRLQTEEHTTGPQTEETETKNTLKNTTKKKLKRTRTRTRKWLAAVIDLSSCGWIDVTACDVLKVAITLYGKSGYGIYLARGNSMVLEMLKGSGVGEMLEMYGGGFCQSVHDAVKKVSLVDKRRKKYLKKMIRKKRMMLELKEVEESV